MRRYDSFVIRCWGLGEAEQRLKIEHVQSGAAARVMSLAEALAWLAARGRGTATTPDRPTDARPDDRQPRD